MNWPFPSDLLNYPIYCNVWGVGTIEKFPSSLGHIFCQVQIGTLVLKNHLVSVVPNQPDREGEDHLPRDRAIRLASLCGMVLCQPGMDVLREENVATVWDSKEIPCRHDD